MARTQDIAVFVSSTSEDLKDYRAVARDVILDMQWRPVMMEHFDALPDPTVEACRKELERCDVVLLIVAWRQGWVPSESQGGNGRDSVTFFELAHARERKIPVLALLANDYWPVKLCEDDSAKRQWITAFRETLNQVAAFFEYEAPSARESERLPRFRALVKQTLLAHKQRVLERGEAPAASLDYFDRARQGLLEGTDIPVLGCGIYGDGPLSSQALAKALLQKDNGPEMSKERISLATAAEYRERFDLSRDQFLKHFRKTLELQAAEAARPQLLDLLARVEHLPLIVSATYDRLLEETLDAAGRKYVTVSHVLRSYQGKHDRMVLVLRNGQQAEFCRADQLLVKPDECVLYKPLGSPFINDAIDPELEVDTVVVTETDHAAFLQFMESLETGVPGPMRRWFRRSPLLFLGYTMDVWQYRLTMLIFQSADRRERRASTLAVRFPDTEIEEMAWKGLNANLVRMDPNQFARSALGAERAAGSAG